LPEILVPVATPFDDQLEPDAPAYIRHCRTLLASGANGLAPFGTTSEANSLSVRERRRLFDAILEGGIDPQLLMPGTGLCNVPETVELTREAVSAGCRGVLMLPPFYYKGVSEDGLFRHFASVIEAVGEASLRVYLYHIPPQAQVGIPGSLVRRLVEAFGPVIAGLKDSSGDWANTQMLILQFPGLEIFSGSEASLLANIRAGGAGAISATANVNVAATRALIDRSGEPEVDQLQDRITAVRRAYETVPMIPALKHTLAAHYGTPSWRNPRPPLLPLSAEQISTLEAALAAVAFEARPQELPQTA